MTKRLYYQKQLVEQQCDFPSNHSTSLVITDFYENLLQNLDKNFYLVQFY